ncbi:hybrid sensor histidine kinase/response regulator [Flavobacterium hiemivividum]|uniref:histidine kinase n=1 Tax=Flavobacterium hiemivividum TaxID=2541734 RepID=A0A4R5CWG8_9FLAO|nr:hybrid sensor histidine kinase/response regulator [Flavobacterium hiemivividum]TDE04067.1 hybrid sensor histidine kinase/response regulator [Flavobacterium hiemivividum]
MKKRTNTRNALMTFFFMFIFMNSYAQYVFRADALPQEISLHPYTSITDVGQKELDIQYVISNYESLNPISLKTANDDLGFTQNNFWAQLALHNPTDSDLHYYLETALPITDLVELYTVDVVSGEISKAVSGDALPFAERAYDNRRTIFKIEIPSKASLKLFLHLKSDGEVLKIPVILRTADNFIKKVAFEQLIFGVFYGILAIVAIIYFFFFFALGKITFLYYSLYVIFVGLLQFALDGFFYEFVTPQAGWFSNHAILFIAIIAVFLSGKYSEVFLKIKKHSKTIYNLFNLAYILLFLLLVSVVLFPTLLLLNYLLINILTLVFLVLIVYSIVYLYFKRKPVDSFFTTGILFLILGFTVFILHNFGLLPSNFITQNSSKLGTGMEVIFLSLSMSNLIRSLKNEKNELNRIALVRSEEMNDLKTYFLSNISHELRTPLNAIMNLIDSVSNEVEDEKIRKNCQVIKYSSHSLLSSVNDILDFSKIEKKELKIENILFSPMKVIESLKSNAEIRAKDKGLDFQFLISNDIPELIKGDETRLVQIINNVLSNAIKFTSEGCVSFNIHTRIKDDNKVSLIIKVSDSGVGIPKDKMESIFDSFSQNNIDNKRKFGGLGLGLFIVKTLVDMQDGTIKMQSTLGEGTSCEIKIDYDIVELKRREIVASEPVVYDLGGKTILVVEDNAMNQMVIKMITKKWLNTTVLFANNGQEGLEAFITAKIDLVLMDLQMPVMDGYEATIAIRNGEVGLENANIPIIAVTADVMESTKARVAEIGMNHYLSKPIKKEDLYKIVKELA